MTDLKEMIRILTAAAETDAATFATTQYGESAMTPLSPNRVTGRVAHSGSHITGHAAIII